MNLATYDCSFLLLLNSVIYQRLSSIFASMKLQYICMTLSFFETRNIHWGKKKRLDLLKEWKLYYQRVGSIVWIKECKIFFGSTKD